MCYLHDHKKKCTVAVADLILRRDLSVLEAVALALSGGDSPLRLISESDCGAVARLSALLFRQHIVKNVLRHTHKVQLNMRIVKCLAAADFISKA